MLFGWGRRTRIFNLGNGFQLVCVYRYFHLWYVIRFITSKEWYLQGESHYGTRQLTNSQLNELLHGQIPVVSAYGASIDSRFTPRAVPDENDLIDNNEL